MRQSAAGQHGLEVDGFAEAAAQQVGHSGHQPVGFQRGRLQRLLARKREQALGQRGGAPSALLGIGEVFLNARIAALEAPQCEIQPAEHHGQHVVEVVGDAAGQLADGLHLLGLPQGILGFDAALHLVNQVAGALLDLLLQRRREAAQLAFRMVALLLALADIDRRRHQLVVDVVELAHRQAPPLQRRVVPERIRLLHQGACGPRQPFADHIGEEDGENEEQRAEENDRAQDVAQRFLHILLRNRDEHPPSRQLGVRIGPPHQRSFVVLSAPYAFVGASPPARSWAAPARR